MKLIILFTADYQPIAELPGKLGSLCGFEVVFKECEFKIWIRFEIRVQNRAFDTGHIVLGCCEVDRQNLVKFPAKLPNFIIGGDSDHCGRVVVSKIEYILLCHILCFR